MKHNPHDLSDVIIHPIYKTKQFELILRFLFVLLYPEASLEESNRFSTAIIAILNGNLDSYKAYQQCCAFTVKSRTVSSETAFLFTALEILRPSSPYPGPVALAEAMVDMLEDESQENFEYWNGWFEARNAAFEQWIFQQFVELILNDD